MKKLFILTISSIFYCNVAYADIRLPAIFGNNMVLQRNIKIPIWGWGDPREKVVAHLGEHSVKTKTGPDGKWKLYLDSMESGGPYQLTISGKNKIVINNVLIGEVWICSGQSNMAMTVGESFNAKEEIASANNPNIRFFQVKRAKTKEPLVDVLNDPAFKGTNVNKWVSSDSTTVKDITAVGYYFIRDIYKELNVPVAIISTSWGGTAAEAWTPHETLKNNSELSPILDNWLENNNEEKWLRKQYASHLKEVELAKTNSEEVPLYFNQPSVLYNGMIAPIIPYGIRGVTWYQGEGNASRPLEYRSLFPAMIKSWREKWNQGDFPFLFVQLANFMEPEAQPVDSDWAELREAQTLTLKKSPNTGMAVIIDVGEANDIHPKNKQDVGKRLALSALKIAYKKNIVYSGPMYASIEIDKHEVSVKFNETGEGLMVKNKYGYVNGFALAGSDKVFYWAKAYIKNKDTIMVTCDEVSAPEFVRYNWSNNPGDANLYNKEGLPASPFRTDTWIGVSY